MIKHTDTPWKINAGDDCPTVCFVGDVKIVAAKLRGYDLHENDEIDAAFIVRAVNAHDDLVEALRSIVERSNIDPLGTGKVMDMRRIATEALAKHGDAA